MIHKRTLHHYWRLLRNVKPWYFLVLAAIFGMIAVAALRNNNFTALELLDNVQSVDQQNGDTEAALRELRTYMHGHMNTELSGGPNAIKPPIQLKHRFERLVQQEKQRVADINAAVAADAQRNCAGQPDFNGCTQQFVSSNSVIENTIPDDLYKYDFYSPAWSPDLAGFSLLASAVSTFTFLALLITERLIRRNLKT